MTSDDLPEVDIPVQNIWTGECSYLTLRVFDDSPDYVYRLIMSGKARYRAGGIEHIVNTYSTFIAAPLRVRLHLLVPRSAYNQDAWRWTILDGLHDENQ